MTEVVAYESDDASTASDSGEKHGRWTHEEHRAFVEALQLYGKDWKKVQTAVKTRSSAQIRSHAQKYFQKASRQEPMEGMDPKDEAFYILEMCENVLRALKRKRNELVPTAPSAEHDESLQYLCKYSRIFETSHSQMVYNDLGLFGPGNNYILSKEASMVDKIGVDTKKEIEKVNGIIEKETNNELEDRNI